MNVWPTSDTVSRDLRSSRGAAPVEKNLWGLEKVALIWSAGAGEKLQKWRQELEKLMGCRSKSGARGWQKWRQVSRRLMGRAPAADGPNFMELLGGPRYEPLTMSWHDPCRARAIPQNFMQIKIGDVCDFAHSFNLMLGHSCDCVCVTGDHCLHRKGRNHNDDEIEKNACVEKGAGKGDDCHDRATGRQVA